MNEDVVENSELIINGEVVTDAIVEALSSQCEWSMLDDDDDRVTADCFEVKCQLEAHDSQFCLSYQSQRVSEVEAYRQYLLTNYGPLVELVRAHQEQQLSHTAPGMC